MDSIVNRIVGFEHIHRHTDYSLLDGYATVEEYAKYSKEVNQQYLCITDHGMMAAIPQQIRMAEMYGLKNIFGCELYVKHNQPELSNGLTMAEYLKDASPEEKKAMKKSNHLLAIAYTNKGYSNLVKLTSWGWTKGYYNGKPRVNHEQLIKHKEGIIFTSCCYNGEIGQAFDKGGEEAAYQMLDKYLSMFGRENFYLEIMLLDFNKQKPYNVWVLKAAEKYKLPLLISNDCHYCRKEDSHMQRLMLMIQTKRTLQDIQRALEENQMTDLFELQDANLWMKSEEELTQKWLNDYKDVIDYDLLEIAKKNTVEICRRAEGVELDRSFKLPQLDHANEKLKEEMIKGFQARYLPKTKEYLNRLKEEYELITRKDFSSYFLIQKMMTDEARRVCKEILGWGDGSEAVGCGRGSGGGSLICYCLNITDVNPVKHGLLFSRFLSESRVGKSMKTRFTEKPILV